MKIKLPVFEGPLDLLLHLIKKNEIDIHNIPIASITEQYLEYLAIMKSLNLDIAGEFIVMASTLMEIKSKMLLPIHEEEGEEIEEEDPRKELVERLIEYQKFKGLAEKLFNRKILGRDVFTRDQDEEEGEGHIELSLFELLEAFKELMEKRGLNDFHDITLDKLTIQDKIREIMEKLRKVGSSITFDELFWEQGSKTELILTFLAILELVKLRLIRVYQEKAFATLYISLTKR